MRTKWRTIKMQAWNRKRSSSFVFDANFPKKSQKLKPLQHDQTARPILKPILAHLNLHLQSWQWTEQTPNQNAQRKLQLSRQMQFLFACFLQPVNYRLNELAVTQSKTFNNNNNNNISRIRRRFQRRFLPRLWRITCEFHPRRGVP